ncbi:unnamed protein product [Phytophthora lilii]|uniref:Unnamed protein product n=1 Tax=Phytophthora lilii TaxID=2077276 RepID=A0A9W6X4T3_9STRA|nr:unnamed protein product [Phytophthora lilii]
MSDLGCSPSTIDIEFDVYVMVEPFNNLEMAIVGGLAHRNLPARGKMVLVALTCALVGNAGVFGVKIDDSAQVWELKKAIKAEKPNDLKDIDADKLQLCLAKTEGGAWLPDEDSAALDLEKGTTHADIRKMVDAEQMRATKTLQFWLFEKNKMPQPSADQIHVLVVVPKDENDQESRGEPEDHE